MTRTRTTDRRSTVARLLLTVVVVTVLVILLWPTRPAAASQNALQAWFERLHARGLPTWLGFGTVEFLANVVMFLPLGFLTVLGWPRRPWWVPVIGWLAFSAAAELIQASLDAHRLGDWRDVLANGTGAVLGVLAARWWLRRAVRGAGTRADPSSPSAPTRPPGTAHVGPRRRR